MLCLAAHHSMDVHVDVHPVSGTHLQCSACEEHASCQNHHDTATEALGGPAGEDARDGSSEEHGGHEQDEDGLVQLAPLRKEDAKGAAVEMRPHIWLLSVIRLLRLQSLLSILMIIPASICLRVRFSKAGARCRAVCIADPCHCHQIGR